MNARAPIEPVHFGDTAIDRILDIGAFSLDAILEVEPAFLSDDAHEHDDRVQSFVFRSDRPFDSTKLQGFLRDAIAAHARDLMRYKGIVSFAGMEHRVVFQGVHMVMGSELGRRWADGEPRESRLVFIGRDLPRQEWLERARTLLGRVIPNKKRVARSPANPSEENILTAPTRANNFRPD